MKLGEDPHFQRMKIADKSAGLFIFLMERCRISCVFECITFTSVCDLTQGSTSAKEETSTIAPCLCGMMYVNDNL